MRNTNILLLVFFSMIVLTQSQTVQTLVPGSSTFNDGLAVDAEGNIYASMYYGSTVTKITPSGETSIFAGGLSSPNGLNFGPDGNLYVPNAAGNTITKVTLSGDKTNILSTANPAAILFVSDTSYLVSHYELDKISIVDTNGNISTLFSGYPLNGPVGMVKDQNGTIYVGNFDDGKIFKTTAGNQLVEIADIPGWLGFMALSGDAIYATAFQRNKIYKIPLDGSGAFIFAGSGAGGTNNGALLSATFDGPNGIAASVTGDTLYISDYNSRSLRMIVGINSITGIENEKVGVAEEFELEQNYPNPFNPSTLIEYYMPKDGQIKIQIYDMLGNEIKTLIDGDQAAGTYQAVWNGTNNSGAKVSSGSYVYRLVSGDYSISKKMLLMK